MSVTSLNLLDRADAIERIAQKTWARHAQNSWHNAPEAMRQAFIADAELAFNEIAQMLRQMEIERTRNVIAIGRMGLAAS